MRIAALAFDTPHRIYVRPEVHPGQTLDLMGNDGVVMLHSTAAHPRADRGPRTYTLEAQTEPIVFNLDLLALAHAPAKAIAMFIRERIASTRASERTLLQIRAAALSAYQRFSRRASGRGTCRRVPARCC